MKCVICSSETSIEKKDVYKCDDCNHIYIDYKDSGLDYHKNEYRKNGEGNRVDKNLEIVDGIFTRNFHLARKTIMEKRCDIVSRKFDINIGSSVLDIGAGGGTFAMAMNIRFKSNVECQEISEICLRNLSLLGFKTHSGDFNDIEFNKQYDLVTCWHALEHIKDLKSYATNLSKVVKDTCILEVPINRRLKEPNNGNWDGHYHFFTEKSMDILFGDHFSSIEYSRTESVQQPALLVILKK